MKGVVESTSKHYSYNDYVECLKTLKSQESEIVKIAQNNHDVFTLKQTKMCLSAMDIKRYVIDGISTYAFGHHKTLPPSPLPQN